MKKTAVILINVGSPDKPTKKHVRRYLSEFLNDPMVIDLPFLLRKILVNLIIIPFRTGKSTKLYKKIWTKEGSPLIVNTQKLTGKLNDYASDGYRFYAAMRYGQPSLETVLGIVKKKTFDEVVLFPLFPQYASSTSGTAEKKARQILSKWQETPLVRIVEQFYNHPAFINAFAERIKSYDPDTYDQIIFSYHGLPERHIRKTHPDRDVKQCRCDKEMPSWGKACYRATCYATTKLLAESAGIKPSQFTIAFQSRLSKNWLSPFTEDLVKAYAQQGIKKILVIAPSFVSDCLETTYEIGKEYRELFIKHGGKELRLVESLNDSELWVEAIKKIT